MPAIPAEELKSVDGTSTVVAVFQDFYKVWRNVETSNLRFIIAAIKTQWHKGAEVYIV